MDRREWIERNRQGLAGEKAVARIFKNIGLAVKKMGDRRADLQVGGEIEVKSDGIAHRSGRFAVETRYRGKPSGITNSTARTWACVTRHEIFLVEADRLREAIADLPEMPVGEGAMVKFLPLENLREIGVRAAGPESA